MKNIRLFILSSSLVLAAWLGASYMTEVTVSPDQTNAGNSSIQPSETAQENINEEVEFETTLPIIHVD